MASKKKLRRGLHAEQRANSKPIDPDKYPNVDEELEEEIIDTDRKP